MASPPDPQGTVRIRRYWNERIHDLEMTRHPVGTREFFEDLDEYRFDKLDYLRRVVAFERYAGQRLLEVGCGVGTDLVRFARAGAQTIGLDLSETAIGLARLNAGHHGLSDRASFVLGDGEALPFPEAAFDVLYAHGVLQYTADPRRMIEECRRVLRPGGEAIFMVYNRLSWLNALSKLTRVALEHEDAPSYRTFSLREYRRLLSGFRDVRLAPERFPVRSRLHRGWKGALYNGLFVGAFNVLPRALIRPLGWHLMAFCKK